jgi:hypothetical protein
MIGMLAVALEVSGAEAGGKPTLRLGVTVSQPVGWVQTVSAVRDVKRVERR